MTGSTWDLSHEHTPNNDTIILNYIVPADRRLAWLSSERFYQQMNETKADTHNIGLRFGTHIEYFKEGVKELKRL